MTATSEKPRTANWLARLATFTGMTIVYGGILFLAAGTMRWPAAWAYLAITIAMLAAYAIVVVKLQPDLIEERSKPPKDAKPWDKKFVLIIGVIGPFVLILLCGLDRRLHWSAPMEWRFELLGLLLVAASGVVTNIAVAKNRFFSALVRIQHDRGHTVVDRGPYAIVRHPAYSAAIANVFGTALALGSMVGFVWGAFTVGVILVRTAMEDRTLREELPGYAEYARRVRFRLLPGIW